jgi:uncharacterized membrane protein HdeD (DUF308 family)
MADMLARNWWIIALRGVAALIFGVLAFLWPGIALIVLVMLFGVYVLVDGIFNLINAALASVQEPRWIVAVMGIAGVIIGIVTLVWSDLSAIALIYLIAALAVTVGAFTILAAIRLRHDIDDEWLMAFIGVVLVLFGLAIAIVPGSGALALVWLISAFVVAYGVLQLSLAFRLRSWSQLGGSTV